MFLKRIELKGFKSFADRTAIDFGEGITCIVGPNGSGKSNITDAFRWVLGEQRYKTLRGNQMQDVIFSGTRNRKALGFAEVTIVFDNATRFLDIDFEEVSVTRRLYRSGESSYAINDAECRLKDVKQLFMDTGVGVEGYSIIGQGRIDSILSTNKEERRLIFEESAGIVKYRTRKTEAERKLGRVTKNLERISDIVSELEARVEPLREQAEKATQYKALADELKALEINLFVHDIERANDRIELLNAEIAAAKEEIETAEQALQGQLSELSKLGDQIEAGERLYREELSTIGQLKGDIAGLEGEIAVLIERASALEANGAAKRSALERDELKSREVAEQLAAAEAECAAEVDALKDLQQSLQTQGDAVATISEALAKDRAKLQIEREQIDLLQRDIDALEQANHRLAASDEVAESRLAAIAGDSASFQSTIADQFKLIENLEQTTRDLSSQIESDNDKRKALSEQIGQTASQIKRNENALFELRSQLAEDEATKKSLQAQEARNEGFSHAVKKVLEWSKGDAAVYGSVKDLFTIDKKFFTAIETALARQLQSIVVSDEDVVDGYIERLKRERAGRATFIPVAQVAPRELPARHSEDGYYGCAWYLIECNDEVAPAFKYLLSGIFFTDTLNDAKRMAKKLPKGARVISLSGEVLHVGGTITGGSLSKRDTGYLARKDDIKNLALKIAEMTAQRNALQAERDQNFVAQEAMRKALAELDDKIAQGDQQLNELNRQRAAASRTVDDSKHRQKQVDDELATLRRAIQQRAVQMESNNLTIAEKRDRNNALQAKVAELTALIEDRQGELYEAEGQLTDCRIAVAKAQEVVKRADLKRRQLSDEKLRLKREIDSLRRTLEDEAALRVAVRDDQTKAEGRLLRQKSELLKLTEKTSSQKMAGESLKASLQAREGEVEQLRNQLQTRKNDVFKVELDLTRIETRRESLIQNLWETYELSYVKALDYKADVDIKAYASRAKSLKRQIKQLGDVNLGAIAEYETVDERYRFLSEQQGDLLSSSEQLNKLVKDIDRQMKKTFKDKFAEVNDYFSNTFAKLFGGGVGQIKLQEGEDVLDAEIIIQAQPPGKKLQSLELLSGGEKALTAIALLFAILKTKSTPFCILDEIEAALDDVNIYRFAEFLQDFVKDSQFIIITHRKGTMEIAEYLYGVTMKEQGITTLLSVELADAEQMASA